MNLRDLARSIESKAKPGTEPLALTLRAHEAHDTTKAPAPMALPERAWIDESETLKRQLADAIAGREAFKAEAHRNADARDAARRELSEMTEARRICVDRIATLTRELAEARADRAAEDRTANRVQVATDANAWHFEGPQGDGTADRIKAVGGRWVFHKRSERERFIAAGYWLVPISEASTELLNALSNRRIRVAAL